MRALALAGLTLLAAGRAGPVVARASAEAPSTVPARPAADARETPGQVARRYRLAGEVLVAKGDKVLLDRGYGTIDPRGGAAHKPGERWRLASITKQIVAVTLLREFGIEKLDTPIHKVEWSGQDLGGLTLRQLLTHHTGLANPDDTPKGADGVPRFYQETAPDLAMCLSRQPRPSAAFAYNNCDYIVAGMQFGGALAWDGSLSRGLNLPRGREMGMHGYIAGKPEPAVDLGSWYTARMLLGTAHAVFDFDRSLMTGRLLSLAALAELWKPEGHGSYQALGQWVFPGRLKGCAAAKRIVQRDGEIYGVQARNYIFPDDDLVVIVFTNQSADDFAFGEVWQGKGFAYDLLSAAVCP